MNKKSVFLCLLTVFAVASLLTSNVLAASSGTSAGTATVTSSTPSVNLVECNLYNAAEDTVANNTALTVSTEYHLNFTINDTDTMANLNNITIVTWDSHEVTQGDVDSQRYHYTWTYVNSTDTWSCPLSASYIDTGDCVDASGSLTETGFTFKLAFLLSKVANYSNGGDYSGWKLNITVYDNENNAGTLNGEVIQHGIASYLEIGITDSTHTFTGAADSSDNAVSAGGDAKVDFTAIANRVWKAQVKANQSALEGVGDAVGESINCGNVTQYGSDSVGDSAVLTTDYADVTGITSQAAPSDEGSPSAVGVYLWLDIPAAQTIGEYVYGLDIQVTSQS